MLLNDPTWHIRLAREEDVPNLHALIEASVRGLQANDYTPAKIAGALGTVLGLDTQLIRDQTYFVVETLPTKASPTNGPIDRKLLGCGGWSKRKTLFGSDNASTQSFVAAVKPEVSIISVAAGNKPGYPSPVVLDRLHNGGSQIYRTDQAGTVEITVEKDRFWVQSEK